MGDGWRQAVGRDWNLDLHGSENVQGDVFFLRAEDHLTLPEAGKAHQLGYIVDKVVGGSEREDLGEDDGVSADDQGKVVHPHVNGYNNGHHQNNGVSSPSQDYQKPSTVEKVLFVGC